MKRQRTTFSIVGLGIMWGLIETAHFGWNWTPKSDAEMICDGFVFIIVAIGFLAFVSDKEQT